MAVPVERSGEGGVGVGRGADEEEEDEEERVEVEEGRLFRTEDVSGGEGGRGLEWTGLTICLDFVVRAAVSGWRVFGGCRRRCWMLRSERGGSCRWALAMKRRPSARFVAECLVQVGTSLPPLDFQPCPPVRAKRGRTIPLRPPLHAIALVAATIAATPRMA